MGTRAIYGFKKDNKYKVTYSNFDGGYEDIGQSVVDFVNTTSLEEMKNIFNKIILVEALNVPTEEQILECKKYANLEISLRTLEDFCCLLAKTIGNLKYYRDDNLRYMINHENELYTEQFGYIINLDNEQLEIYWYEQLVKSYSLSNIPKKWINECNKNMSICYKKWEKTQAKGT